MYRTPSVDYSKIQLPEPTVDPGPVNPHPAAVMKFLSMDQRSQYRFMIQDPVTYAQIYNFVENKKRDLQQPQPQPQPQVIQPPPMQQQLPSPQEDSSIEEDSDSELLNDHSSDEEGELDSPPVKASAKNKTCLSLDFRLDLKDIAGDCTYTVSFNDKYNVKKVSLESCILSANDVLLGEPYIYMSVKELGGRIKLSSGDTVFAKLNLEKQVNGFLFYTPENSDIEFSSMKKINHMTITFHTYDMTPIPLTKLGIKELRKSKNRLTVSTKAAHFLKTGDRVNFTYKENMGDKVTVDSLKVLSVESPYEALLSKMSGNPSDNRVLMERVDVKCILSFGFFSI